MIEHDKLTVIPNIKEPSKSTIYYRTSVEVADEEIFMEDYDEISIKGGKLASEKEIDNLIKEVDIKQFRKMPSL